MRQAGQALVHLSFIHLFNHYLLRLYYMLGPVLGVRDTMVNKADLVTTL